MKLSVISVGLDVHRDSETLGTRLHGAKIRVLSLGDRGREKISPASSFPFLSPAKLTYTCIIDHSK